MGEVSGRLGDPALQGQICTRSNLVGVCPLERATVLGQPWAIGSMPPAACVRTIVVVSGKSV